MAVIYCNYSDNWQKLIIADYILFTLTSLWINKYRLLIDHAFRSGSSTDDICGPEF